MRTLPELMNLLARTTASQQAQEKLELKQRKVRVAELEQLIRQEAEALEAGESLRLHSPSDALN